MNKPIAVTAAALCAFAALSPTDSAAQTADSWKWQASVYGYLPDISGRTTFPATGASSNATLDAKKIIDTLKFTFMGGLEGSNGRWGVLADAVYMDLGNSKSGYRDFTVGGSSLPAGVDANAHSDLKSWVWTIAGTWRIASDPASKVDLVAGARLFDMKQTFRYELTGNVAAIPTTSRTGAFEAKLSNWDAIVGLKARYAVGEDRKWFIPLYADVGTGESKSTWQVLGGIGYAYQWGDVVAAWRYIDYKMKSGSAVDSLTISGPAIAAVFRW